LKYSFDPAKVDRSCSHLVTGKDFLPMGQIIDAREYGCHKGLQSGNEMRLATAYRSPSGDCSDLSKRWQRWVCWSLLESEVDIDIVPKDYRVGKSPGSIFAEGSPLPWPTAVDVS
jgi:hypothetical protein